MKFDQIKQELQAKSCSISIIARVLGKSHSAVRQVAMGQNTSREIATAISKALELPIRDVFPNTPSYHQAVMFKTKAEQDAFWQEKLAS